MNKYLLSIGLKSAILVSSAVILPVPLLAQSSPAFHFDMPTQSLDRALRQVARKTGVQIMFSSADVAGLTAPKITGDMTAEDAVRRLLAGTNLVAEKSASAIIIRGAGRIAGVGIEQASPVANDIVVTGTRIRGASAISTVIALTRDDILRSGQTNLGEAVRSLPQSFNGGQNPGVGVGAGGARENENLGSGATINLRGLGQDATLTLFNGHRVAYNVASQGVDVSSIPLEALDRIEIVADGASALYGSDAVGGVANIILKRDYDGLWTGARVGTATDGGDWQQEYGVVGGRRWRSGGFLLAYDFERDTPIVAGQRSYTAGMYPGTTLLRSLKHHNFVLNGHQELTPGIELQVDADFNKRWSNYNIPILANEDYRAYGIFGNSTSTSFFVAPSIQAALLAGWRATLSGVISRDRTRYGSDTYVSGSVVDSTRGCYCNGFESVEASAEGAIFDLPGGPARLAIGGGYRNNSLHAFRTVGGAQDVDVSQDTWFAYGEVNLPLVSPAQNISGLRRLALNAAVRYEDYPGADRIATPKAGIIYSPFDGLELKASWGRSFKAPTLYQRFSVQYASLYSAAAIGGTSLPSTATALVLSGANPNLSSERAQTLSLSAVVAPPSWRGFRAEFSYFNVDYHDRVATPIPSYTGALGNPAYAALIDITPSASQIASVLNPANYQFYSYVGGTFDPSAIAAIIDNRYRNIARQSVKGLDFFLRYATDLNQRDKITATANLTYLDSSVSLGATAPVIPRAGIIFNPPHFRGRGGVAWDRDGFGLASYVNHIGPLTDNRYVPSARVKSMTSLDATAHIDLTSAAGALRGLSLLLSVQNILNARPGRIRTAASYATPYDSTNYSAVGRFLSLSISKRW